MRQDSRIVITSFAAPEECKNRAHKQLREAQARIAELEVQLRSVPRHGRRGEGAHYAADIKELSDEHLDILDILDIFDAKDYDHGIPVEYKGQPPAGKKDLTALVNDYRSSRGRKPLRPQTISGRLSEMQGPTWKLVHCYPTTVQLTDPLHYEFRSVSTPLWYLTEQYSLKEFKK